MPDVDPFVIAGPILRRVDGGQVCVWMALRESASVTVHVFSGRVESTGPGTSDAPLVGRPRTRKTRAFGPHLHVVVVDADVVGIPPRTRHSYDVVVDVGGTKKGLKDLGLLADGTGSPKSLALGYADDMLPSFVTPAADLEDLRLVHASCRKPHGHGVDALAWLDERIQDGLSDLDTAPQQLFLTGDQIYADDVAGTLLPVLHALGEELVGPEKLPIGDALKPATMAAFPALRRQRTVRDLARFTTTDGASHLLTFGEYAAMYCAAWSTTVWQDRPLADPASLFTPVGAEASDTEPTIWEDAHDGDTEKWKKARLPAYEKQRNVVARWRDDIPKVARALANVPTYMIFDDHEVTDDWNITAGWRRQVASMPLGRAILRNGLMAYTIFQAWGNDPASFRHDEFPPDPPPPEEQWDANEQLLSAITRLTDDLQAPAPAELEKVDRLAGLSTEPEISLIERSGPGDVPGEPRARFHYEVPGPMYTVRVLDTRTRRSYRSGGHGPPRLLGSSLDEQLPESLLTDGRELLVLVSPVPVLFPRLFESLVQPVGAIVTDIATHISGREGELAPGEVGGLWGSEKLDVEGWRADEVHHERLLARLGSMRRVVVLSGDVHFASTLVLDYWGKDDATLDSRIVQCTSSSARNQQDEAMLGLLRTLRIGQQLLRGEPCERIGWQGRHGVVLPAGASIRPGRRARMIREQSLLPARGWPAGTTTSSEPHWRWRLEVIRDDRPSTELPSGAPEVPVLTWNAADPVAVYHEIAGRHQQVNRAPRDPVRLMVFGTNLGLVSFAPDRDDLRVSHTLMSVSSGNPDEDEGDEFTEHTVPFAPVPTPDAPVLRTV